MDLYKEILTKVFEKEEIRICVPNLSGNIAEIIKSECYIALREIKTIIEDDNLSDFECIEKIICVFEGIRSDGGNRHDFG